MSEVPLHRGYLEAQLIQNLPPVQTLSNLVGRGGPAQGYLAHKKLPPARILE
jgi:hypothetical protein